MTIKNDMEKNIFKQQTGGSHYQGLAVTPIEYAMRNKLDACQFSVVKYITRFRDKNGLEDLNKCKDFVDMLIRSEYSESVEEQSVWHNPETIKPKIGRNCLLEMVDGHIYVGRWDGDIWWWADGAPTDINRDRDVMYSSWCGIDASYEVRRWCYVQDVTKV